MVQHVSCVNWFDISNLRIDGKDFKTAFVRSGLKLSDGRVSVLNLSDRSASMSAVESNSVRSFPGRVRACSEAIRRLASLLVESSGEEVAVFEGSHEQVANVARGLNFYARPWVRIKLSDTESRIVSLVGSGKLTPKRLRKQRDTLDGERLVDRSEILLDTIARLKASVSMSGPFCRARRSVLLAYDENWKLIDRADRSTVGEASKKKRVKFQANQRKEGSIRCVIRTPSDHHSKEISVFKHQARGRMKVARMGKAALESLVFIASKSVGAVARRIVDWCSGFIHRSLTKKKVDLGDLFEVELGLTRQFLRLEMGLKRRAELGY